MYLISADLDGVFVPQEENVKGILPEDCPICANPIKYIARYSCNHITCYKCALRLRALMGNNQCVQCRTDRKTVVITTDTKLTFDYLNRAQKVVKEEPKYGLRFNSESVYIQTLRLLKFNCPYKGCRFVANKGWQQLRIHTKNIHHLVFCPYCTEHKKLFTHEFSLYTKSGLKEHEHQTTADENGFKGHPLCTYCKVRFYSQDEWVQHLKLNHEDCFICSREQPDVSHFFRDYNALEVHFRTTHFVCKVPSCLEQKFVVFATASELEEHNTTQHSNTTKNTSSSTQASNRSRSSSSAVSSSNSGPSSSSLPNNNSNSSHHSLEESSSAQPSASSSSHNTPQKFTSKNESALNLIRKHHLEAIAEKKFTDYIFSSLKIDNATIAEFDVANNEFLFEDKSAYDLLNEYRFYFPKLTVEQMDSLICKFCLANITNEKTQELCRVWENYRARMQLVNAKGNLANAKNWGVSAAEIHGIHESHDPEPLMPAPIQGIDIKTPQDDTPDVYDKIRRLVDFDNLTMSPIEILEKVNSANEEPNPHSGPTVSKRESNAKHITTDSHSSPRLTNKPKTGNPVKKKFEHTASNNKDTQTDRSKFSPHHSHTPAGPTKHSSHGTYGQNNNTNKSTDLPTSFPRRRGPSTLSQKPIISPSGSSANERPASNKHSGNGHGNQNRKGKR